MISRLVRVSFVVQELEIVFIYACSSRVQEVLYDFYQRMYGNEERKEERGGLVIANKMREMENVIEFDLSGFVLMNNVSETPASAFAMDEEKVALLKDKTRDRTDIFLIGTWHTHPPQRFEARPSRQDLLRSIQDPQELKIVIGRKRNATDPLFPVLEIWAYQDGKMKKISEKKY